MAKKKAKHEYANFPIRIKPSTRKALDKVKIHPRESLDDVIIRLVKEYETARS